MKTYRFSECGVNHRLRGLDNQDACFVEAHGGHAFAFMADGMGSARFGDEAANIAVEAGRDIMGRLFMPLDGVCHLSGLMVVRAAFPAAYNAIQRAAQNEDDLNDLLTTFMAAYLNEGTGHLHMGYCGDGGVIARLYDGSIRLVTAPHKGAKHSQTSQVLDCNAWEFVSVEQVSAFMMLTDGLFDALCPGGVLPEGDAVRMEALGKLLEAPLGIDDPRMRPYLDAAFSSRVRSDDLGALFECVGDDRSVIAVCADPQFARRFQAVQRAHAQAQAAAQSRFAGGAGASSSIAEKGSLVGSPSAELSAPAPSAPAFPAAMLPSAAPAGSSSGAKPAFGPAEDAAPSEEKVALSDLPLSPRECQQVRLMLAAYGDTRRALRFRKKMEAQHARTR